MTCQKLCILVLAFIIATSGIYLAYHTTISQYSDQIQKFNKIRLHLFELQHLIALYMILRLIRSDRSEGRQFLIYWMVQFSSLILLIAVAGQIYILINHGRLLSSMPNTRSPIYDFQVNYITMYFQIMTNFVMFFIISIISLIVLRFQMARDEERFQFIVDNLKSEDYVDDFHEGANKGEKKSCSICLNDLDAERVLKLPCNHYFHKTCVIDWLKRSNICPLCRNNTHAALDQGRNNENIANDQQIQYNFMNHGWDHQGQGYQDVHNQNNYAILQPNRYFNNVQQANPQGNQHLNSSSFAVSSVQHNPSNINSNPRTVRLGRPITHQFNNMRNDNVRRVETPNMNSQDNNQEMRRQIIEERIQNNQGQLRNQYTNPNQEQYRYSPQQNIPKGHTDSIGQRNKALYMN